MLDQGYGIMPNNILFDNELTPNAKLLYCYISSLCAEKGYCWARNEYFAEKFNLSTSQVSRLINSLEAFLDIKDGTNKRRKIYLREPTHQPTQKAQGKPTQKAQGHNNSISKNINTEDSAISKNVQEVYELYLQWFKIEKDDLSKGTELLERAKRRYKLSPVRRVAITTRLKDAGLPMLKAAIVGYARDSWYQGDNDRGWKADLQLFICRSYEKVEEGANKFEAQNKAKNSNDPWA